VTSEGSISAVLLPQDSDTPMLVQLPCTYQNGYWKLEISVHVGGTRGKIRSDCFPGAQQRRLVKAFYVLYVDDFMTNASCLPNKCVSHIYRSRGLSMLPASWRGNMLLVCSESSRMDPKYESMSTYQDIMNAIDFLLAYDVATYNNQR
jgi:hypothetical protein